MKLKRDLISLTGVKMPRLIYGTAWKKERTADLVFKAISEGFSGIDTACQPRHYEEKGVGDGLQRAILQGISREDIFLQTKFTPSGGQDLKSIPYDPKLPYEKQIEISLATSLKNLNVSYIDSFVLHSPLRDHEELMEVWRAMEKHFDEGKVKQLGISNLYHFDQLITLFRDARIKPAVLQNRFYRESFYDHEIRNFALEKGIFYQCFWTLTANPHLLDGVVIQSMAKRRGKSAAQIFFRSLTQMGIIPLTGTCSTEHMKDDLSIFEFELSDEELLQIKELLQ